MSKKTVTVYGATGSAGVACVNEFIRQGLFNVCVLARQSGQTERSSSGMTKSEAQKQAQYAEWEAQGVTIKHVDVTIAESLVPALQGTHYVVSCVPLYATESQYPLIWAAKEAGGRALCAFRVRRDLRVRAVLADQHHAPSDGAPESLYPAHDRIGRNGFHHHSCRCLDRVLHAGAGDDHG